MALSSNEHELLVSTCENMNVAAGTCREVLEMLRNLGNTGVVDIATHNNTPGAHSSDPTLMHIVAYVDYDLASLGDIMYTGWGINMSPTPVHLVASPREGYICLAGQTRGEYAVNKTYLRSDVYVTDSNGNRIAFSDYDQSKLFAQGPHLLSSHIFDADNKDLSCSIKYVLGNSLAHGDTQDVTSTPYTSIQFFTANGFNSVSPAFAIDNSSVVPGSNNAVSLGLAGRVWKDVYTHNAVTVTSDRREKTGVSSLGSEAVSFIKALRPVGYKLAESEGVVESEDPNSGAALEATLAKAGSRTHWGLIAQEVKEALSTAGIEDAAVWCLADKNDPDSKQALRYEELIAPMIKVIQQQQERIEALERKVA